MFKRLNLNSFRTYFFTFGATLVVAFLARTLWFYHGVYAGPTVPESPPESIPSLSNAYEAEQRLYGPGNLVLFDTGHDNGVNEEELGLLAGRMATGGSQVEFTNDILERLHEATVFVSVTPSSAFTQDEIVAVEEFVRKGGRVILVGDPTRVRDVSGLNSLASEFGVVYQQDYIYNIEKNDGNFRNVIFSKFAKDNALTDGLDKIVFQTAHSLRASEDTGIVFGDDSTFVSSSEKPGGVIAAALVGDGRVLMLPDMTFLTAPYNSFADNDHFIDNIVGFALSGDRTFEVDDFPYYFGATTDIVYQDPTTLDKSFADFDALRDRFTQAEKTAALVSELNKENPTIYLSTYDDIDSAVESMLDKDGITISGGEIKIENVTTLETSSTALFHLVVPKVAPAETGKKPLIYSLIVLGDSQDDLSTGINTLLKTGISDCMVTGQTAVCQTDQTSSGETPSNNGGGSPSSQIGTFLVVADDELVGSADLTSAAVVADALTQQGHTADQISILDDGPPTVDTMLNYDGVFWSSGSYAPSESSLALLKDYLDKGGHLFIDGAEIAFYWSSDPFLSDYLRASYQSYGPMSDMQVGADDHPLNQGFGGSIIKLSSGSPPDIIQAEGSQEIFVRGPDSDSPGATCMVAYEDGGRKVAFASFELHLLDPADLSLLVTNAASWFTSE